MDRELQVLLNEIGRITFEITALYQELTNLMLDGKDTSLVIKKIKDLKKEENELYDELKENIAYNDEALHYLSLKKPNYKDTEASYAYTRIGKRLARNQNNFLLENADIPLNGLINHQAISYLTSLGYSEEDANSYILKFLIPIERSLVTAVHNIALKKYQKQSNKEGKRVYLEVIIKQLASIGDYFEDELLSNNFSYLPNRLKDELKDIDLPNEVKQEIIKILIIDNIFILVAALSLEKDAETYEELLIELKGHLLHLTSKELETLLETIELTALIKNLDVNRIKGEINNIIVLRKKASGKGL